MSALFLCIFMYSCSVDKYIPSDKYYLKKVNVVSVDESATRRLELPSYVKQQPNTKWFGVKAPLSIYCSSSPMKRGFLNRTLRKLGEEPVLMDTTKVKSTITDMNRVLNNAGYIHSIIDTVMTIEGKKVELSYIITPGVRYIIRDITREVDDSLLAPTICVDDTCNSLLKPNTPLNITTLNNERKRIASMLRNKGYYRFNKEYITFVADTLIGSEYVDLTMRVSKHQEDGRSEPMNHPQFHTDDITYIVDANSTSTKFDTIYHEGNRIVYKDKLRFRPSLLTSNTLFNKGELYNEDAVSQTYNSFTRLGAVSYTDIRLYPDIKTDSMACNIVVNHALPQSLSFDVEGTNTAGDLGAALSTTYQHRNLFKGSESLMLKLRGAYEAITGLEGYDGDTYTELGGEVRLGFPGFLLPYIKKRFGTNHRATSEISMQYNYQNRPEFNRRVLTAAWRYRWQSLDTKLQHRFDLLEVNYINMPWISSKFKEEYLDAIGKRNSILLYNYENILLAKLGYSFTYNSLGITNTSTYGKNAYIVRANLETAGNSLNGLTSIFGCDRDNQGHRKFLGIAYAQYIRGDIDFSRSIVIDPNNSFAWHVGFGIAVPYGNSNILPFEKRYFAGGANSVRGWSVRSLGPGAYKNSDNTINFINQTGDIKLDMNVEWRTHLLWKFNGALFIDAGNVWTIHKYVDQPGGEFKFNKFIEQIAIGYGLGLRMSLDFFTLRLDAGMKAIDPAYSGKKHYPVIHPKFSRDFAFHFAVGLPF